VHSEIPTINGLNHMDEIEETKAELKKIEAAIAQLHTLAIRIFTTEQQLRTTVEILTQAQDASFGDVEKQMILQAARCIVQGRLDLLLQTIENEQGTEE